VSALTLHSPPAAQLAHPASVFSHTGFFHTPVLNLRSWIHFVAVHLVPPVVGQLACMLDGSVLPLFVKLKNRTASPVTGLTLMPCPLRHAQSLSCSEACIPRSRAATAGSGFACGNAVSPPTRAVSLSVVVSWHQSNFASLSAGMSNFEVSKGGDSSGFEDKRRNEPAAIRTVCLLQWTSPLGGYTKTNSLSAMPPRPGSCRNMSTVATRFPPFSLCRPSMWSLYCCPSWYRNTGPNNTFIVDI